MSLKNLRQQLPPLDGPMMDFLFSRVYEGVAAGSGEASGEEEQQADTQVLLAAMQRFNFRHRMDEAVELNRNVVRRAGLRLQHHSEGSDLWLALLLAIKELYGLGNNDLLSVLKKVTVRN